LASAGKELPRLDRDAPLNGIGLQPVSSVRGRIRAEAQYRSIAASRNIAPPAMMVLL